MRFSLFQKGSNLNGAFSLYFLARLLIGGVLIFASISKLVYPNTFIEFANTLLRVDAIILDIIFIVTITVEIAIGFAIILWGNSNPYPALFAGLLFMLFSSVVFYAMTIDLSASCGCFGTFLESEKITSFSLLRNLLLAGISFLIAFRK